MQQDVPNALPYAERLAAGVVSKIGSLNLLNLLLNSRMS